MGLRLAVVALRGEAAVALGSRGLQMGRDRARCHCGLGVRGGEEDGEVCRGQLVLGTWTPYRQWLELGGGRGASRERAWAWTRAGWGLGG